MLIDIHAHIMGDDIQSDEATLLRAVDEYEIDRLYISGLMGFTPTKDEVAKINREVANFIRQNPNRFGGYAYISPEHDNAMDMVRQGIEEYGLNGIKIWVSTFCDDPFVNPVVEAAINYHVPILVHSFHKANGQIPNESTGKNVAVLAARYPEARIIMAHLGGNCYNGIPAIEDLPNVWVDFSGSLFRSDELIYAVERLGADRILFGSDLTGSFLSCYGQVLESEISTNEKDKILYKNALTLFDHDWRLRQRMDY